MKVACKSFLLDWGDILLYNVQPFPLIAYLIHVDVNGWYIFIASSQSGVLFQTNIVIISL